MANEATISVNMSYSRQINASAPEITDAINISPNSITIDITNEELVSHVQSIGTTEENLTLGDVTAPGYMVVHNLDATNFVELGYTATSFRNFVKVPPGGVALFALAQTVPQAKADTAACLIRYTIIST